MGPRMRLVVIGISTSVAFGVQADAFIRELARRSRRAILAPLLDEASWATPRFAPFVRMALGVAARRGRCGHARSRALAAFAIAAPTAHAAASRATTTSSSRIGAAYCIALRLGFIHAALH